MSSRFARRAAKFALSACVALGLCSQAQADGWLFGKKKDCCPAPSPTPSETPSTPPAVTPPGGTPAAEQFGAGESDVAAFGAPNMLGNILQGYRGVTFSYLQAGDFSIANTSGAVTFRNTKIAENNSALPRDRVSLRYNYFHDALGVAGLGRSPQLGGVVRYTQALSFQFNQVVPATRSFDAHVWTLQGEKTFGDGAFSLEARIPVASTLSSDLELLSGTLAFPAGSGIVPLVPPTPENTTGHYNTEIQDIDLIFKALLWKDCDRRWAVSGGFGLTLPTGNDLKVHVRDFSNDVPGDPILPNGQQGVLDQAFINGQLRPPNQFAFDQRDRFFRINNDTFALSPFIALVATPNDRLFINGFTQVDLPLNRSDWSYRERDVDLETQFSTRFAGQNPVQYDRTLHGDIRDQTLLHLDIGGGYWLYLCPSAERLNGIASMFELHYTTTLDDADIVTVPANRLRTQTGSGGLIGPEAFPRLGNVRNRLDILDATVGATFLFNNRATLATAVSFPLKRESDRSYDWELQVHLNLFFGGAGVRTPNY